MGVDLAWPENKSRSRTIILLLAGSVIMASILTVSLGVFPTLLIAVGLGVIVLGIVRPEYPFYLLLLVMPPVSQILHDQSPLILWGLVTLVSAAWLVRQVSMGAPLALPPAWLLSFMALMLFWMLVSDLHSGLTPRSLLTLIRTAMFFGFFIVAYNIVNEKNYRLVIILPSISLILTMLPVIPWIMQHGGWIGFWLIFTARKIGYFRNPNVFAASAIHFVPLLLALWFFAGKIRYRRLYIFLGLMLLVSVIVSNSRSAYLALALCGLYFVIASRRHWLYLVAASLAAALIYFAANNPMLLNFFLRLESGLSRRDYLWAAAIKMIKEQPVFGIGAGNYPAIHGYYLPTAGIAEALGKWVNHAHNFYLHKTVELGIPGFFLILFLLGGFIKEVIAGLRAAQDRESRAVLLGLMGLICATLAVGFFEAIVVLSSGGLFPEVFFWLLMIYPLKIVSGKRAPQSCANGGQ